MAVGNLEKDERNAYAKEVAYSFLEDVGIEITPQIEAIVAGIIEMTCMVLPHGVEPETQIPDADIDDKPAN